MNCRTPPAIAVLVLAAIAAVAAKKNDPLPAAKAKAEGMVGNPAPEFSLPDSAGQTVRLADLRGKIVVLAFWATWRPPCRAEMPGLTRLQKQLAPEGVAVIPIANDDPAQARQFPARKKLDALSLFDNGHTVSSLYGANVLPRTFVLDRNGIVVQTHLGKMSESDVRQSVQAARH
jgi:peroxiredoxin